MAFVEGEDIAHPVTRGEDDDRRVREADAEVGVTLDDRARLTHVGG